METIVIGAGAAGLMAAYELSRKGVKVTVLEAGERIGGRVHTFTPDGFTSHIEAGAEFIHGNLNVTLSLMEKAGMPIAEASLRMQDFRDGKFQSRSASQKHWDEFGSKAKKLRRDCTLKEFFDRHFAHKKYGRLRTEAWEMAAGLDLADPERLSVFCVREEWVSRDPQYRPVAGYGPLFEFLSASILRHKGEIRLNERVRLVSWKKGSVEVVTGSGRFKADNIIVTASLGNLQTKKISFEPGLDHSVFEAIGFGEVIKVVMEFHRAFWEDTQPEMGFLFTDDHFTFWTQLSLHRPLLTGWIGNDRAAEYTTMPDDSIVKTMLGRLSEVFPNTNVAAMLRTSMVFRYTKKDETGGGYSWTMPESRKAIKQINEGIADTVWFAGEAFHTEGDVGTVESAFHSGRYIARKAWRKFK